MRLAALLSTIALFRACQGLRPAVSRRTSRTALRSTMASFSAMATDADVEGASERDGVVANLAAVKGRVAAAAASKPAPPTLLAVSKLKPLSLIAAAHAAGHVDFGENYVQELVEKAAAVEDGVEHLKWHFIGRLQSNKVRQLCGVKRLEAVHTVSSEARGQARRRVARAPAGRGALKVFVQVNTSGEEAKGGCEPRAPAPLQRRRANLQLEGLMCIGKYSGAEGDASPDFVCLRDCRDAAAAALG
ncbi:hypothetical protein JL722_13780 [Aureococcus anophagefferens]|nr:hypothetical protein JL722_13780 [Aureococcus anophagefferens]